MIRAIALTGALLFGVLLLYLPSSHPPGRFLDQVRMEHNLHRRFWGAEHADRVLARALDLISPGSPGANTVRLAPTIDPARDAPIAASNHMAQAAERLFDNEYVHGIQALLLLANYRLSALLEWLPCVAWLVLAACIDGWAVRKVKAHEFHQHRPEVYAVGASSAVLAIATTVVLCVTPFTLPPPLFVLVPLSVAVFVRTAVANYHHGV